MTRESKVLKAHQTFDSTALTSTELAQLPCFIQLNEHNHFLYQLFYELFHEFTC